MAIRAAPDLNSLSSKLRLMVASASSNSFPPLPLPSTHRAFAFLHKPHFPTIYSS
jgi:hypothetical protein